VSARVKAGDRVRMRDSGWECADVGVVLAVEGEWATVQFPGCHTPVDRLRSAMVVVEGDK